MRGVAIIGCGAIGSLLAEAVDKGIISAKLLYLMDLDKSKASFLASKLRRQKKLLHQV